MPGPFPFGGERGIRTPGLLRVNSFQDCRDRPLRHFSGGKITNPFQNWKRVLL